MNNTRKIICIWLFEKSKIPYSTLFKRNKKAWDLDTDKLLAFPVGTLGYSLGKFLHQNNFQLIPKLERHDAFHVITGYGTEVENEIALQYFLLGNGKRSLYLFGVTGIGLLMLPEYFSHYIQSYQHGRKCGPVHQINIRQNLSTSLINIRYLYNLLCHS